MSLVSAISSSVPCCVWKVVIDNSPPLGIRVSDSITSVFRISSIRDFSVTTLSCKGICISKNIGAGCNLSSGETTCSTRTASGYIWVVLDLSCRFPRV